jgi:hypothetical protein
VIKINWTTCVLLSRKHDCCIMCSAEGTFWTLAVGGTDSFGEFSFIQAETKFAHSISIV